MFARRKWWLGAGAALAIAALRLPFTLGYACYHNGFHWGAFKDDCNRCNCAPGGAVCTLRACGMGDSPPPCKNVVDKRTGKPSCEPCRISNQPAFDERGEDMCCEGMGLEVFSPPLDGKPGAGVPVCSRSCRSTGESCNVHSDCCHEEDRCEDFVCVRDPGWRMGRSWLGIPATPE